MENHELKIGSGLGEIRAAYNEPAFIEALSSFEERPEARLLQGGRHHLYFIELPYAGGTIQLALKKFGDQPLLKDAIDEGRGSKAHRSFDVAARLADHGCGTPEPIAWIDFRSGPRLERSYYLCRYVEEPVSFKDVLCDRFQHTVDCTNLINLLQMVAVELRKMHDSGVQHNDLGNQNILLQGDAAGGWTGILLIDLNRANCPQELSMAQRAKDLSRIYLPSDMLRVFFEMYFAPGVVPDEFKKIESRHRKRYHWHTVSRKYRHPLRTLKNKNQPVDKKQYPSEKEIWIWDRRSEQAIPALRSKDRRTFVNKASYWDLLKHFQGFSKIARQAKTLKGEAFNEPVSLAQRIGMNIEGDAANRENEIRFLQELGKIPVLIRLYRHEGEALWQEKLDTMTALADAGHSVSAALVQDREGVRSAVAWKHFIDAVLPRLQGMAEYIEVGHAINRVKWGVWELSEYRSLVEAVQQWQEANGALPLTGPAVIDFEYHFLPAALRGYKKSPDFAALSHHLYVDRRGAPENFQGSYDTLGKLAVLKAAAQWSTCCNNRVIISEVNWPLLGTGEWSPVVSPYDSPTLEPRKNDPSVSEEEYALYTIRYLLITLCSGLAERVYWWKLAAHGFGLIDPADENGWRVRPAFRALKYFIERTAGYDFVQKHEQDGLISYRFENAEGAGFRIVHRLQGESMVEGAKAFDLYGEALKSLRVGAAPVYVS